MKVAKVLYRIKQLQKGKTPYTEFRDNMYKIYTTYSLENAKTTENKVLSKMTSTKKVTQKDIDKALDAIQIQYLNNITSIEKGLTKYTAPLYEYRKLSIKIKKAEGDLYTDDITGIDKYSIKMLTETDMIWILDHTNKTTFARDVASDMEFAKLKGYSVQETGQFLKDKWNSYTPTEYAARFGENSYWKLVVHNQTQRIKTHATVNNLTEAGYTTYTWITQGAEACPICTPYDNKTYNVKDASDRIDKYYEAGENGDVEGMEKADPFLTLEDVKDNPDGIDGMMPMLHHRCYCYIRGEN